MTHAAVTLCLLIALAAAAPEPRDITGIEEVPAPPPVRRWPIGLALGLTAAAGVILIGWKLRPRRATVDLVDPSRWALAEFERIEAEQFGNTGQTERYHTLLSNVVRRYFEMRHDLHAPRQTTPEFLNALRCQPILTADEQTQLAEFLERCDLAKFAPVVLSPDECGHVLELARRIVRRVD